MTNLSFTFVLWPKSKERKRITITLAPNMDEEGITLAQTNEWSSESLDSDSEYTAEELCTQAASWDSCTHARSRRNLFLIRAVAQSHRSRNSMSACVEKPSSRCFLLKRHQQKSAMRETWTCFSSSLRGKLDRERRRQPVIPAKLESTVRREMKTGFPVHLSDSESVVYHSPKSKTHRSDKPLLLLRVKLTTFSGNLLLQCLRPELPVHLLEPTVPQTVR